MIAFLSGRVVSKGAAFAVVEVGGVGFRLLMSTPSLAALPAVGDDVTVHTYLNVREDELTLFGFESEEERETFERLISVGGVGPKLALAVLSSLKPDALRNAVARDDIGLLSTVPGVGKKTAQRVIIELKDKLGVPDLGGGAASASIAGAEARDALLAMGFSSAEVAAALRDVPDSATAEQMLRLALRALGGGR